MEREVYSFCIYCSSDWMSFSNDSGASNEPKRLTTFPFLEIRNLEKFHFTEVVPMNPFAKGFMGTTSVKWNFSKFLISKKGKVVKRFGSLDAPESFENDIQSELQ